MINKIWNFLFQNVAKVKGTDCENYQVVFVWIKNVRIWEIIVNGCRKKKIKIQNKLMVMEWTSNVELFHELFKHTYTILMESILYNKIRSFFLWPTYVN